MKTDRFSDSIRRKLESIRPEFTDKDWTRMQASLQQAIPPQPGSPVAGHPFPGGVWSGSPWMLAAASVSTVVLIAFAVWQRSEINHLREAVGQLRQQTVAAQAKPDSPVQGRTNVLKPDSRYLPETGRAIDAGQQLPGNRDTAAGSRYNAVPGRFGQRESINEERSIQRVDVPPQQREDVASQTQASVDNVRPENESNKKIKTDQYGVSSTSVTSEQSVSSPSVATRQPADKAALDPVVQPVNQAIPDRSESYAAVGKKNRTGYLESGSVNTASTRNNTTGSRGNAPSERAATPAQRSLPTNSGTPATDQAANSIIDTDPTEPSPTGAEANETIKLAASLPLSLPERDWNTGLIRRAKRMRLVQPSVAAPTASPMVAKAPKSPRSQPISQPAPAFRVGVTGEVSAHLWSAGVVAELPVAKRFMVGLGISQATYLGGLFLTPRDFDNHTHRDFKKEFGRGLPPYLNLDDDILNIDTRVVRIQMPVTLSYRIPLSRTLTLLPTAGTYVNLSSQEKTTYYYRINQRGFDQLSFSATCKASLLSGLTIGSGLEWQLGHWVVQGTPFIAFPTKAANTTPGPGWETNTAVSLRARVLYQF